MNRIRIKFGFGMAVLAAAMLTGCASGPSGGSQQELATSSDQTDIQKRASIRLQLAVGYYEQRQWKVALDEIKQALAADPNYADAYGVRALIYMEMAENRLAEDNFLQALKLSPNNSDFSNNYGWFLCQNGREADAIAYFDAALANGAYQAPVKALNNAGVCSVKMKRNGDALQYFSRAFQLDSAHPLTNTYLAKIYLERDDQERSRFYLNRLGKADFISADVLWVAIKVARKLGDRESEMGLASQLQRRHANSSEYSAYQREAFDD